jgi:hypothetical protein
MIHNNNLKNVTGNALMKKIQIQKSSYFFKINGLLPHHIKIKIPSFITRDYIDSMLYKLEEMELENIV